MKMNDTTSAGLPGTPTGELLRERCSELVAAGKRLGATNLRVFGSAARGDDEPSSDIDILVDLSPTVTLVGLGRLEEDFEAILQRKVDVVPASGLKPGIREQVLHEAVPLESA